MRKELLERLITKPKGEQRNEFLRQRAIHLSEPLVDLGGIAIGADGKVCCLPAVEAVVLHQVNTLEMGEKGVVE